MFRRLSLFLHQVATLFRHVGMFVRNLPGILRRWAAEWAEVITLPFRLFRRPRTLGAEMVRGGKEAIALGEVAARGTVETVISFLWLLVRLPWIVGRFLFYDGPYRALVYLQW